MFKTSVADVKARLSEYLERASRGERIVICRHNRPIAELRAVEETRTEPRPLGPLAGRPAFDVPSSFFEPLTASELDDWDRTEGSGLATRLPRGQRSDSRVAEKRQTYRAPARRRRRSRS